MYLKGFLWHVQRDFYFYLNNEEQNKIENRVLELNNQPQFIQGWNKALVLFHLPSEHNDKFYPSELLNRQDINSLHGAKRQNDV